MSPVPARSITPFCSSLFEALDREGYEGWIGCEYKPKSTTSAGLGWAEHYLGAPVGAN